MYLTTNCTSYISLLSWYDLNIDVNFNELP